MNFFKLNSYFSLNRNFNSLLESILEDYFSPEFVGIEGYLTIGDYNDELAKKYTTQSSNQKDVFFQSDVKIYQNRFSTEFSSYENMICSHLYFGNLKTYVFSGAMGSGKSTTIDFIFEEGQESELIAKTIFIKLDFNKGYNSAKNIDDILEYFLLDLYDKLKVEVIERVYEFKICTEFLLHVKSNFSNYEKFYDFSFEQLRINFDDWDSLDEQKKMFLLFKYIEQKNIRHEIKVDMVMKFLNFIDLTIQPLGNKVIIFYDNIDRLPPAAQINILHKILALNKIASIKKIIALRRSTKAKLDKLITRDILGLIEDRSQSIYGHIYHHGPSPWRIYRRKIDYLIENFESIKMFEFLPQQFKSNLLKRSNILNSFLHKKDSLFTQAFYCLSGESNRLGLTLASRPFVNCILPYTEHENKQRNFIRSLYVGNIPENRMANDDPYIANIFSNSNMEFSLINIILYNLIQFYYVYHTKNEPNKASFYYMILQDYFEFRDKEIVDSFNYLMNDKRALIGGQFQPKYKDSDELFRVDDNLRVTELGDRYFNKLLRNGGNYIQTCLISLKYPFASEKYLLQDNLTERIKTIRDIIAFAKDEENFRLNNYYYNCETFKNFKYSPKSFINNTLFKVYEDFVGIYHSLKYKKEDIKDALDGWVDMVTYWSSNEPEISGILFEMEKILHPSKYKT